MRELVLGTAGHIDHGKTALVGALTGIDTDRLSEEKQRGISIDLGFAHLQLGDVRLGIVDVPGHERFVKNMLAGASGIDLALLVVAADDSVMPQTREHLAILELLRIRRGLIALTKVDLAEPSWVDLVEEEIRDLVRGTFLEGAPIVRTSATAGTGIETLRTQIAARCEGAEPRAADEPFRIAVDRSFVIQGLGTVVTGTVSSGAATVGDEVEWLPPGRRVRVRDIQRHGESVGQVAAGQRAALNLSGVHHTAISRGHELATPGFLSPSHRIAVRLEVIADSPWPIRHRSRVRLHLGTQVESASVRLLERNEIVAGAEGLALLTCAAPVMARNGQPFVLRSESPMRTIGGGIVLQPVARLASRRDRASIERLRLLGAAEDDVRAAAAVFFHGARRWSEMDLIRDAGLRPEAVTEVLARLESSGDLVSLRAGSQRQLRLHASTLAELRRQVVAMVEQLHQTARLLPAIDRARIAGRLGYLDADVVAAVIDALTADGSLSEVAGGVALPGFAPALTEAQQRLRSKVVELYGSARFRPPDIADLSRATGAREEQLRPILELCAAQQELVRLESSLYIHRDTEMEMRRRVTGHLGSERGAGGSTVSELKALLETSRKFAVPMCEHLDRVGVTRRQGDRRVLAGSQAKET